MASGSSASLPSTIHIDGRGQVQDHQGNALDLTKPEFSEINRAMTSEGSKQSWPEGDYRLENGRLVQTSQGSST